MQSLIRIMVLCAMTAGPAQADQLSDEGALRALDQAYAQAWLKGDADAVMDLFTQDATLVPHHGDAPIEGRNAIRQFWFNPSYSPTVVPEFRREAAEVVISGDIGIVRGRSRLTWEYDGVRTTIPEGNYVIVALRMQSNWRIRMLTWNDDPREWHRESID